jgi:hypothetical protein
MLLLLRLLLVPNLLLLLIMPARLRRDLAKLARIHENDSEQLEKRATHVRNGALPFSLSPSLLLSWLCPFSLVCPKGRD